MASTLERVNELRSQGQDDNSIYSQLSQEGISPREIEDAFSREKIKRAVTSEITMEETPQAPPSPYQQPQEAYPAPAAYGEQPSYDQQTYSSGTDSNTVIEFAEQVFSEKIKPLQKKVEDMTEFKNLMEIKMAHMEESVKRMENTIDKLQLAVLDKVGSYGQNLESIKNEMNMMQETFSKTLPALVKK